MTHDTVPPLLAVAVLLLVIKLARERRNGKPLRLFPQSLPARATTAAVVALVVVSGVAAGQPWDASVIPAVALGGLVGAFVDLRHR
ncbi:MULTISPECIES: hypothetical protein [Kitasatospora]|uniref:Uncharacterized protein n=1 Tax=Kitasatospora cathayae TaxID=3004092 RepID=A0ABY7QBT5_9ACTN|nr:hypothetical protein [Kitasatospora sp. HUAS 3-15]WBP90091.1 hypothetical protein O1G21_32375 [Kitasatospora sp. HUAS 3-15]